MVSLPPRGTKCLLSSLSQLDKPKTTIPNRIDFDRSPDSDCRATSELLQFCYGMLVAHQHHKSPIGFDRGATFKTIRTMACTGGLDRPILVGALVFYSSPMMPVVIALSTTHCDIPDPHTPRPRLGAHTSFGKRGRTPQDRIKPRDHRPPGLPTSAFTLDPHRFCRSCAKHSKRVLRHRAIPLSYRSGAMAKTTALPDYRKRNRNLNSSDSAAGFSELSDASRIRSKNLAGALEDHKDEATFRVRHDFDGIDDTWHAVGFKRYAAAEWPSA